MTKHSRILLLLLFTFIFSLPSVLQASERVVLRTTLDNGLTVILEEDTSAPVVAFQMWVRTGSADEEKKEAGIAHVFEHMLFKGTAKRAVGEIARAVEEAGGDINAYTSYDNTVYHLALASRNFSTGLDIISDAIQNSAFDPEELEKELEVVLEEQKRGEDNPGRKLFMTLLSTAYSTHPYKYPVIGTEESVKGLTRDYIINFFKRWYIPNNMTLVIVGDFKTDKALKEVKKSFGKFKKAKDPHKVRPVEPEQKETKTLITVQPVTTSRIGLGFHIPEQKHEDSYAIDVAAEIIGSGVNSRLYKRLKINEELVQGVSTYAMTPKEPGVFFITAVLDTKNIEKTISAITEEILRIGDEGPKHKELQKTKIGLESGFIYERETMQGKASQLGYYETTSGGLDFEKKYVSGLRQVSGEDVKRVIKKYLTQENMTISLIVAEDDKDLIDEKKVLASIKEGTKNYLQAKGSKENKATAGTAQKFTLPNGITLIVNEDHSNATVALYASFPGGLRFEDSTTNGTGNFMSSMLSRGTTKRTRSELAMELDMIAGGVRGFSGKNSSGVSGEFLSRFFEEGLALFAEVTLNPSFPNDEIERLRSDIIASIKRDEDYLPGYTFKLLRKAMYDKHPYRMHVKGSTETVSKISRDDLISHYKRIFNPEQMVFSVVGDVSTSRVLKEVTKIFGDFKGQKTELKKIKADPELGEIKKTGAVKDKEQTNIGIGFLGTTMDSEDQYPLVVLAEILSSQGGRLFTELRDKKSLAYAVSAFSSVGIEPGIFGFYIGCAPEKKEAAIKGILAEIEKVTRKKVTRSELKRAKNALLGGYAIGLQNVSNQASDSSLNELYGLGFDFYKKYPAKIEAVSRRDILKAAKKYLTLKSYAISVVGPSKDKDGEKKTTTTGERKKSHGHGH